MTSFRTKCDLSCILVNFSDFMLHKASLTR
jgi:hypothetical protein